jgi:hypothetical protein
MMAPFFEFGTKFAIITALVVDSNHNTNELKEEKYE